MRAIAIILWAISSSSIGRSTGGLFSIRLFVEVVWIQGRASMRPDQEEIDRPLEDIGGGPTDVIGVTPSEVFTPSEVLSIFRAFHQRREIASEFEVMAGVLFFGRTRRVRTAT